MLPVTERELRDTFINASRKEIRSLTLPEGFEAIDWDRLDYFGWQDPKIARRAYVVVPTLEGTLRGILFRRADATPRGRAQCAWCADVTLLNEVVLYTAKRSAPAG